MPRPEVTTIRFLSGWALCLLCLLVCCLWAACPKPPQPKPKAPGDEVEIVYEPTADELVRKAGQHLDRKELEAASATLSKIFAVSPKHLEAWVLRAMVQQAMNNPMQAHEAWEQVEQILVYKGKLKPFELQTTLFAAAGRYVERGREKRIRLFMDELWRRFPKSPWTIKAQLQIAETAHSRQRWSRVVDACGVILRLRPVEPGRSRCEALTLAARRMLEIGPAPAANAQLWSWEHPLPQGNTLNDVWVGSNREVFVVGDAGTILHLPPGARRFSSMASPTRWSLQGIWGTAPDHVVAVGDAGVVLKFDGKKWSVLRAPAPEHADLWGVYSTGPDHVVAVGDRGTVVQVYAGSVAQPTTVALRGIWGTDASRLYAVGAEGTILRTMQGKWEPIQSDTFEDLWSVWGASDRHVLAVGNRMTLVQLDGTKAAEKVVGRHHFRDAWGFGEKSAWVVGTKGEIVRYTGRSWRVETSGTLVDLYGVAGHSKEMVWAVGDGGTILNRRGNRWKVVAGGMKQKLVGVVAGPKPGEGQALGERGAMIRRDKKGSWRVVAGLPVIGRYRSLWSDGQRWVAVGDRGLMVVRDKNGKNKKWERIRTDTPEDLVAVWGWEGGAVAVGTRGTVVRLNGDKVVLDPATTGLDLNDVWASSGRSIVAVGNRGVVIRFDGERWTELPTGTLTDLEAVWGIGGKIFVTGAGGMVIVNTKGRWTKHATPISQTLVDIWGGANDRIFAISRQGSVIRFDGTKWQVQRSPASCLTAIHGDPATGVLAVGCHGAVLRWSP